MSCFWRTKPALKWPAGLAFRTGIANRIQHLQYRDGSRLGRDARRRILTRHIEGYAAALPLRKPVTAKARPRGENVVDLMDALRKSIGGGAATAIEAPKKPAKKPNRASASQKEMLMPIAGKTTAKEAAAKKPGGKAATEVRLAGCGINGAGSVPTAARS